MTRVGGTPFLPKRIPWPKVNDTVTQFLCQFDFRDSRNLTGQTVSRELPGDLLLVFVADQEAVLTADMEKLRFIWVSADERDEDILTASDMPEPTHAFEFTTAWGVRFRTVDVPSKWDAAYDSYDEVSRVRTWMLPVYWATKIGGVPYHSQEIQRTTPPDYLCQLTSIQVSAKTKWPWVNEEAPMHLRPREDGIHDKKNCLMIGDMGEFTLYLSKNGEISVEAACG
ncbi:DUF1963 domain-containing protein [Rubinisphaera italica]|uniref:Uncharacterized protein n=1 Tax=Rubinisphaera italica TaxID=2527969 RepID=A0A5C5XI79_9PLAN|nr:DUF1963 domain-containing protein [Rubinisphaera italica]TWT62906.1 hypothetical protein Pan54_36570 [Rubinisphaera italica]